LNIPMHTEHGETFSAHQCQ